ncbi:MAG: polymer-forming cytoskeletal protein, partial [Clostridium sp.]|nr:polymer-forming cytoskeletal protein [Clostridium sp.]
NTGSTANCFYAMGDTVALRGSTKSAALAGDTVTIDGTVEGDVEVWADKLVLGKNARITGTVSAHVSEDPERAEGAQVGALKIDRTENENTSTINDTIGGIVAAALSTCFVAILLELVFPRATASAAGMLRQRPTPLWVSGLLGTVAAVPAVLLLIISIAGLSLAGALMCAVIGIALVSAAFTGTAIARMIGHSQNRYAMAAVGGIAAGALTALPLMGSFVSGVAFVFTLGYVIQIIWRNARLKPQQAANTPGLPSA